MEHALSQHLSIACLDGQRCLSEHSSQSGRLSLMAIDPIALRRILKNPESNAGSTLLKEAARGNQHAVRILKELERYNSDGTERE